MHYFDHAKKESKNSDYRVKVGAVLVIGKHMIKGFNKIKTHPKFANPEEHTKVSIHAEIDCILKSKQYDIDGSSIYVYRETKDGDIANSRPCAACIKELRKRGVRRIYYTTDKFPYWSEERL